MDGTARTLYVRVGFYVRPTRTLVTESVLSGVGGRGSALWFGGGRLDLGAEDLATTPPARVPDRLLVALVTREGWSVMDRQAIRAWQSTWRPGAP